MPKRAIAKVLCDEFPKEFKSIETARSMIRYYTGNSGGENYEHAKNTNKLIHGAFGNLDYEEAEIPQEPYMIPTGIKTVGMFGDMHGLWRDQKTIEIALADFYQSDVDAIIMGGDIIDCYQESDFSKDPRKSSMQREREFIIEFLKQMQNTFSNTQIYYKLGNHEARHERYMLRNAPAIYDENIMGIPALLEFKGSRIHFIPESQTIKLGKLAIIHGDEIRAGGQINTSRNKMLRAFTNIAYFHHHSVSETYARDMWGKYIGSWGIGCTCGLKPKYAPNNQWMNGYAKVKIVDGEGNFDLDNVKVINGRASH